MLSLPIFTVFISLAASAALPRANKTAPAGYCCFTLHDAASGATLQQNKSSGSLYFNAGQTDGWYCVDPADKYHVLYDEFWNACFINTSSQFLCHDPTPSDDVWTLKQSGSSRLLARDGNTSYLACPAKSGGEALWVNQKQDKSGCRTLQLKAQGFKGTC